MGKNAEYSIWGARIYYLYSEKQRCWVAQQICAFVFNISEKKLSHDVAHCMTWRYFLFFTGKHVHFLSLQDLMAYVRQIQAHAPPGQPPMMQKMIGLLKQGIHDKLFYG